VFRGHESRSITEIARLTQQSQMLRGNSRHLRRHELLTPTYGPIHTSLTSSPWTHRCHAGCLRCCWLTSGSRVEPARKPIGPLGSFRGWRSLEYHTENDRANVHALNSRAKEFE